MVGAGIVSPDHILPATIVTCPRLLYHLQCEKKLNGWWLPEPYPLRTLKFEFARTKTA